MPGRLITGSYEFPKATPPGDVHVPPAEGIPPSPELRLVDAPFEQRVNVPFVPGLGAAANTTFTVADALAQALPTV